MTDAPLLIIAAGGTGGHMFPAQALAEEMLARGWRVALSTDSRGLRYAGSFPEAVSRHALSAASFSRGGLIGKLAAGPRLLLGVWQAWRWFRYSRPAVVAGFGGYPAFPALMAGGLCRIPRLIHEQNGVLGRVNRLFARRVDTLACGTWPLRNAPAGAPLKRMGNPVRASVQPQPFMPPDDRINLLVFGGSQGASIFAALVPKALAMLAPDLLARLSVVQQAREDDLASVRESLEGAGVAVEVAPFFTDMPARLATAHLVIARAGASSVAELAMVGRPAILIPYGAAMDDHQTANAQALSDVDAAVVVPENTVTADNLAATISSLITDPDRLAAMAQAAHQVSAPRALADLADEVERLSGATTSQSSEAP